jgi:hypothetical protein
VFTRCQYICEPLDHLANSNILSTVEDIYLKFPGSASKKEGLVLNDDDDVAFMGLALVDLTLVNLVLVGLALKCLALVRLLSRARLLWTSFLRIWLS